MKQNKLWYSGFIYSLGALIGLIIVWQVVVLITDVPRFILPPPALVYTAFVENWRLIAEHGLVTFTEVMLGLMIGILLGVATALQLELSPTARLFLRPILVFSQAIPVFALAPVLTLWLGYGLISKVTMAVLIIYFPVTSAFFDGLRKTPLACLIWPWSCKLMLLAAKSTHAILLKNSSCDAFIIIWCQIGSRLCANRRHDRRVGWLIRRTGLSHASGKWSGKNRLNVCRFIFTWGVIHVSLWSYKCFDTSISVQI